MIKKLNLDDLLILFSITMISFMSGFLFCGFNIEYFIFEFLKDFLFGFGVVFFPFLGVFLLAKSLSDDEAGN